VQLGQDLRSGDVGRRRRPTARCNRICRSTRLQTGRTMGWVRRR
jgi:hypothetical protein